MTLEDLIETLIGLEIKDETDDIMDMRVFAHQQSRTRNKGIDIADSSN